MNFGHCFHFVLFSDPQLLVISTYRGLYDPGAQSGNETQFLFSEGDVHQSDADDRVIRPVLG